MKCAKILLTTAAILLGVIPQFPAMAANGEIACDSLVRDNNYSVISRRSGEPVYRNGRVVNYTYVYNVRNNDYRDDRGYRDNRDNRDNRGYRNDRDYRRGRRDERNRRDVVTCVWNARRNSARLILR